MKVTHWNRVAVLLLLAVLPLLTVVVPQSLLSCSQQRKLETQLRYLEQLTNAGRMGKEVSTV